MTKCIFTSHFARLLKCVIWQLSATLHIWLNMHFGKRHFAFLVNMQFVMCHFAYLFKYAIWQRHFAQLTKYATCHTLFCIFDEICILASAILHIW